MSERKIVEKWMVSINHYERGEVVSTSEATYGSGKDERDIFFDTEEEADEYIEKYVDGEFGLGSATLVPVHEDAGINYKEVKRKWAEEEAKRKLYLYPCPFCAKTPVRNGNMAKCLNCNIVLEDKVWNDRKYRW
jgi:hypothetical protein